MASEETRQLLLFLRTDRTMVLYFVFCIYSSLVCLSDTIWSLGYNVTLMKSYHIIPVKTPVSTFWCSIIRNRLLSSHFTGGSYFARPPTISDEAWQILHLHYKLLHYMLSDILSMLKRLEIPHCSHCNLTIRCYFPLHGGNTCAVSELIRLRNALPLYVYLFG